MRRAARRLRRGGLVAFPTETVYGLGADATNARAVAKLFALKRRPLFDPLIVHAATPAQAFALCRHVPLLARKLARAFWPGPLTLVLEKGPRIPDLVTAGLPTVGVRVPAHPAARALIRAAGRPIAAPSANRFGRTSPTTARMVRENFGRAIQIVLDGGPSRVGVESTVVLPLGGKRAAVLRPGGVTKAELQKAGARVARRLPVSGSGRKKLAPGQLKSHYAPRTPLALIARGSEAALSRALARQPKNARVGLLCWKRPRRARVHLAACVALSRSGDAAEAAANLFQAMAGLDRMGLDLILAETPPAKGLGEAVADRLKKASHR